MNSDGECGREFNCLIKEGQGPLINSHEASAYIYILKEGDGAEVNGKACDLLNVPEEVT